MRPPSTPAPSPATATAPTSSGGSPTRCRSVRRPRSPTTSSTTPETARPPRRAHARSIGPSSPTSRRVPAGKRRALGQHFLRDPGIARAIVDLVAPTARDLVVEIGPGEGALTEELARRSGRLVALEVDPELIDRLRRRFPQSEIQHADAREWAYGAL